MLHGVFSSSEQSLVYNKAAKVGKAGCKYKQTIGYRKYPAGWHGTFVLNRFAEESLLIFAINLPY
jgi:hypothetical protein